MGPSRAKDALAGETIKKNKTSPLPIKNGRKKSKKRNKAIIRNPMRTALGLPKKKNTQMMKTRTKMIFYPKSPIPIKKINILFWPIY